MTDVLIKGEASSARAAVARYVFYATVIGIVSGLVGVGMYRWRLAVTNSRHETLPHQKPFYPRRERSRSVSAPRSEGAGTA